MQLQMGIPTLANRAFTTKFSNKNVPMLKKPPRVWQFNDSDRKFVFSLS